MAFFRPSTISYCAGMTTLGQDRPETLRLGSRKSSLARTQAALVASSLGDTCPAVELVPMSVQGDLARGTPDETLPDKKKWVVDLEEALLSGGIDLAVHSGKDVPVAIADGTRLIPVLPRAAPHDVLIRKRGRTHADLDRWPDESAIGTSSLRRKAFLRAANPRLTLVDLRGNVPTRLEKLVRSDHLAAIVVAAAGLARLRVDLSPEMEAMPLPAEVMLPAAHQGILVAQFCAGRSDVEGCLQMVVDEACQAEWRAERAFTTRVGAGCHSCLGVHAVGCGGGELLLRARALSRDGRSSLEDEEQGSADLAEQLGTRLSARMIAKGIKNLL